MCPFVIWGQFPSSQPLHTGELRVPKSQGRNCDQTSLNQDWKWKNGPRYINKGDYVAFCWKYISSICRKRKWIYPMSGKSYICANSAFSWFLKVHKICLLRHPTVQYFRTWDTNCAAGEIARASVTKAKLPQMEFPAGGRWRFPSDGRGSLLS